jgi:hypothetical protein
MTTRWLLAVSCAALSSVALAADPGTQGKDPMAGWKPPQLSHEAQDKQEIAAVLKQMEQAGKKGDLEAAVALVDFPVLMGTDDSKGQAYADPWTKEQWTQVMKPFYEKPMDMKVTHQPTITVLTDSLATVVDRASFTAGGKHITTRNFTLLVRKDGQWKIKSLVEGGWGDAMQSMPSAQADTPSSSGTGSAEPKKQ